MAEQQFLIVLNSRGFRRVARAPVLAGSLGSREAGGHPLAVSGDPACEGSELAGRRSGRILRLARGGQVSFGAPLQPLVNRSQAAGKEAGTGAVWGCRVRSRRICGAHFSPHCSANAIRGGGLFSY